MSAPNWQIGDLIDIETEWTPAHAMALWAHTGYRHTAAVLLLGASAVADHRLVDTTAQALISQTSWWQGRRRAALRAEADRMREQITTEHARRVELLADVVRVHQTDGAR